MEGGEDDLQRGELREFGVRVDRDAAAIVAHGQPVAGLERDLDAVGMAGDRLVHGVVEISAARWCSAFSSVPPMYMPGRRRTGSSPQDLDVLGGIAVLGRRGREVGRGLGSRLGAAAAEQVVHAVFSLSTAKIATRGRGRQPKRAESGEGGAASSVARQRRGRRGRGP
jgi:hypothetical protein